MNDKQGGTLIVLVRDVPLGTFKRGGKICVYCGLCGVLCEYKQDENKLWKERNVGDSEGLFMHKKCHEDRLRAVAETHGWATPQQAMSACKEIIYAKVVDDGEQ